MITSTGMIDRIGALLPFFHDRRLGGCPCCDTVAVWLNEAEFFAHVRDCMEIEQCLAVARDRERLIALGHTAMETRP